MCVCVSKIGCKNIYKIPIKKHHAPQPLPYPPLFRNHYLNHDPLTLFTLQVYPIQQWSQSLQENNSSFFKSYSQFFPHKKNRNVLAHQKAKKPISLGKRKNNQNSIQFRGGRLPGFSGPSVCVCVYHVYFDAFSPHQYKVLDKHTWSFHLELKLINCYMLTKISS